MKLAVVLPINNDVFKSFATFPGGIVSDISQSTVDEVIISSVV